ncbi:MAG TPA: subclass B3 metallo-beta-lactamase [Xanthomonadaceae bacterium]|jgi:metallo-beta-lactamase class B
MSPFLLALLLSSASVPASASPPDVPQDEAPIHCDNCDDWNREQAPFRIFGNTYYVGVHGLSSVLIATKDGLVLLDGDLPQSAPLIVAHIKALGFDVRNVHWILNSHAHFDHAGGIAALQRISGANVAASALAAETLRVGALPADDPQYDAGRGRGFPPVRHVQALLDGETVQLGDVTVTAHDTPGHTPGGMTWTWSSCESWRCANMVYADSLNAAASGDFRFSDASRQPTTADILRRSIAMVRGLSCDVVISVHPDFTDVLDKAAANARDPSKNAFLDGTGCRTYADEARDALDARLKKEDTGKAP